MRRRTSPGLCRPPGAPSVAVTGSANLALEAGIDVIGFRRALIILDLQGIGTQNDRDDRSAGLRLKHDDIHDLLLPEMMCSIPYPGTTCVVLSNLADACSAPPPPPPSHPVTSQEAKRNLNSSIPSPPS